MQEGQAPFSAGTVIQGHYIVESLLDRGGSGTVYLVRDQRTMSQLFALKEVSLQSKRELDRFLLECQLLPHLDHQALAHVYCLLKDDKLNRAYILMEYIEGQDLETLWQQQPEKRFPWTEVMGIIAPIIAAVGYLHRQQPPIIHGNIKPTNIVVPKARGRALLVGLGTAQEYGPDIDVQTDIYGLGAVFYTLITGIVPTDAASRLAQMDNEGTDPLKPVNEVIPTAPAHVARALDLAMSLDAHNRFSSVERFWEALWSLVERPSPLSSSMPSRPTVVPKQAVAHPATVSVPKRLSAPRSWKLSAFLPMAPKQAVAHPATVSVPKRLSAPRSWKLGPLWPGVRKQAVEKLAIAPVPEQLVVPEEEPADASPPEQLSPVSLASFDSSIMPKNEPGLLEDEQVDTPSTEPPLPALGRVPLALSRPSVVPEDEQIDTSHTEPSLPTLDNVSPVSSGALVAPEDEQAKASPTQPSSSDSGSISLASFAASVASEEESAKVLPLEQLSSMPSSLPSAPSGPLLVSEDERAVEHVAMSLQKQSRVRRAPVSLSKKLGILLIVLVLLVSLGPGAGSWVRAVSRPAAHSAIPTPTVTSSTPTSVSGIYPTVGRTYNGTIYDLSVNVSTSLLLSDIRQSGGTIRGYLTVGPKLQGSGPFSGTIDTSKRLQFTVTDAAGHAMLIFEGAMESTITASLSGDYYRCGTAGAAQGNQCSRAPGGYGIWSVVLASSL